MWGELADPVAHRDNQTMPSEQDQNAGGPSKRMREWALDLLAEAFAEDRLETEDYERRAARVSEADSDDELRLVVGDLAQLPVSAPAPRTPAVPAHADSDDVPVMSNFVGDLKVSLLDGKQGVLRVFSLIGDVTIDASSLRPGEYGVVRLTGIIGDAKIRVAMGTRIKRKITTVIGDIKTDRVGEDPNGPILEIRGFHLIGDLEIVDV